MTLKSDFFVLFFAKMAISSKMLLQMDLYLDKNVTTSMLCIFLTIRIFWVNLSYPHPTEAQH